MRHEDGEVYRTNPTLPAEPNNARVRVKIEIKNQENSGTSKGRDHARAVPTNLAIANEEVAAEKQDCASCVEPGVQSREHRQERSFHWEQVLFVRGPRLIARSTDPRSTRPAATVCAPP